MELNVHLLRSPELSEETYFNVLNLLKPSIGPIKFFACEDIIIESSSVEVSRTWDTKEDFEKLINLSKENQIILTSEDSISFPYVEKVKTWNQLFAECDSYRKLKNLPDEDLVVLLTDFGNEPNWFGGISESMNNFFVQTSNWEYIFGNNIDIRYPIAYEVISWVMRCKMFNNRDLIYKGVHKSPIGCMMDYCKHKNQIILKMRTAYVCEECISKIKNNDINALYPRQFFDILDGIRNGLIFSLRSEILNKPSKLEINKDLKFFFSDLGNLELKLNPKEKLVYLLFLNHPDGIHISYLKDYKDELFNIYFLITADGTESEEVIKEKISNLVNHKKDDIHIVLSRINKKIKIAVGDSLSDYYCINGEKGKKKKIRIDRELVVRIDLRKNDF